MSSRLRALRVVHPLPSFINAALVLALALIAGASLERAATLAAAMLGLQFAIGIANDIVDRELDAATKPSKPIPSGALRSRTAAYAMALMIGVGFTAAFVIGAAVAGLWLAMLACGLVYDFRLKPTIWAWACFAVAFAILPVYAWYGAVGALPPRLEFIVPIAALAGPALQIANGLVDLETDSHAGLSTLVTRLGRRRSLLLMGALLVAIYAVAWATLTTNGPLVSRIVVAAATFLAAAGLTLSAGPSLRARAAGWTAQAVAIALLAWGWLGAI